MRQLALAVVASRKPRTVPADQGVWGTRRRVPQTQSTQAQRSKFGTRHHHEGARAKLARTTMQAVPTKPERATSHGRRPL